MLWSVPRIWDGGDVWILGGGPSIVTQFGIPEELAFQVRAGLRPISDYNEYLRPIHDKHVIGINVAYLLGDWIDWVFFGDKNFFHNNLRGLVAFKNLVITKVVELSGEADWLKIIPDDPDKTLGISEHPGKLCWNGNSGAAAISLAANAGAKRIFLLGFDMHADPNNAKHWHMKYKREDGHNPTPPFGRHLAGFGQIAYDAKKRGIEIINVCPGSAIGHFRKVNLKDIL